MIAGAELCEFLCPAPIQMWKSQLLVPWKVTAFGSRVFKKKVVRINGSNPSVLVKREDEGQGWSSAGSVSMVRTRPQHCVNQAWQYIPVHPRGKSKGRRNSRAADFQCNVIFLNPLSVSGSLTNYSHWFLDLDFSCFPFSFPLSSSLCAFSGKPLLWIATEASVSRSQASPHLVREPHMGDGHLSRASLLWTLPAFCCF